eukprot:gb/GFBE01079736.1/.p1 GENE.gb/GFBE01079736.1/~~gb/GFBE01079736.1/.p1  ORF type:complete len:514 (+),score=55.74 gb/GFBE01079736.1/:1-1542(+)
MGQVYSACFAGLAKSGQAIADARPAPAEQQNGTSPAVPSQEAKPPGAKLAAAIAEEASIALQSNGNHKVAAPAAPAPVPAAVAPVEVAEVVQTTPVRSVPPRLQDESSSGEEDYLETPSGGWMSTSAPLGPDGLPSVGSVGHAEGDCKRCCFHPKGRCQNGHDCRFCHYDHDKRKRLKKKTKRGSENPTPSSMAGGGFASHLATPVHGGHWDASMGMLGHAWPPPAPQLQPLSPSAPPIAPPAVASLPSHEPPPPPLSEAPEIPVRQLMEEQAPPATGGAGFAEPRVDRPVTINDVLGPTVAAAPSAPPRVVDDRQIPLWHNHPMPLPGRPPLSAAPGGPVHPAWQHPPAPGYYNPYAPAPPPGPPLTPHPAGPWQYGPFGPCPCGHPPAAMAARAGGSDATASTPLVLPHYTSSTAPQLPPAASSSSGRPGGGMGGDSPRSVILTLSGAWGALSNNPELMARPAGTVNGVGGQEENAAATPLSKQQLLGFRRATGGDGSGAVLKAVHMPRAR